MKILVTGGAGLIGSNLIFRLVKEDIELIVADNLWRGRIEYLYENNKCVIDVSTQFYQYDLRDYTKCLDVTTDVEAVVHLADVVGGINFVFSNQLFTFRSNMQINSNLLCAAIENGVSKYLYVGTACSYPAEKQSRLNAAPLKEEDAYPANPESAYGWSKLLGEYECELAQKEGKVKAAVLRLHNVYGPPCDLSPERSQVIPALCRKALKYPEEEFVVWGSGNQRRAFVYIDDVVDAIVTGLEKGMNKGVIQIGPRESHSIADIAERIVKLSGKAIDIQYDLSRPEGDKDRVADSTKAKDILDWQPRVSIDDGLAKTYAWASCHIKKNN